MTQPEQAWGIGDSPRHEPRPDRPRRDQTDREGSGHPSPPLRGLWLPDPLFPRPRPGERAGLLAPVAPDPQRRVRPRLQGPAGALRRLGCARCRADRGGAGVDRRRDLAGIEGAADPGGLARGPRAGREPRSRIPARDAGRRGAGLARTDSRHRAEDQRGGAVVQRVADAGTPGRQPSSPRRPAHRTDRAQGRCRSLPRRLAGAAAGGVGRAKTLRQPRGADAARAALLLPPQPGLRDLRRARSLPHRTGPDGRAGDAGRAALHP